MMDTLWFDFAVAIALGLLIGLERERSKGEGPRRRPAGIRTFALASLLGALAIHVGGVTLLATALAIIGLLAGLAYYCSHDDDPGLTTDIGLLIAPLLGGLAMSDSGLASGLGAAVAVIFAAKAALHGFVKGTLTSEELSDGLVFAIATLIVWPQLPDRYLGPLQALNPSTLWLLVVLVLAIGACGHVATRALGARRRWTLWRPRWPPAVFPRRSMASFSLLLRLILPTRRVIESAGGAFSIKTALALSATLAIMLVAAAVLKERLGEAEILVGAAFAGLVDAHSAAISVASLVASGKLAPQDAVLPILAGMTCNAVAKGVMAIGAGSWSFVLRIVPGLLLSMSAAWIAVVVPELR